jgi:hypothetical protein
MPVGQREGPDAEGPDTEGPRLLTRIGRQVLQALGEPAGLRGVQVKRLWENHYRANVVVGRDVTTSAVAHSYFLVADGAGTIVTATPAITRRYK